MTAESYVITQHWDTSQHKTPPWLGVELDRLDPETFHNNVVYFKSVHGYMFAESMSLVAVNCPLSLKCEVTIWFQVWNLHLSLSRRLGIYVDDNLHERWSNQLFLDNHIALIQASMAHHVYKMSTYNEINLLWYRKVRLLYWYLLNQKWGDKYMGHHCPMTHRHIWKSNYIFMSAKVSEINNTPHIYVCVYGYWYIYLNTIVYNSLWFPRNIIMILYYSFSLLILSYIHLFLLYLSLLVYMHMHVRQSIPYNQSYLYWSHCIIYNC